MDSDNLDLAQAKEKVVIATKAYSDVMYKKSKKMKGRTKEAIQRTLAALEATNEGLHAAEVSAQKAKKSPSMGREPESGGLSPEPKRLRHTGGKESSVESKLTEGGGLQMLVEVAHSALDGVLTPIPSDKEQDDADISGGTNPVEQTKIIDQQMLMQMLKQGNLFSLAMVAQTTGGDDGDVKAEQGGSKRDGRGDTEDSDGSSSSNKDDAETGKDNGGKKNWGDPPDKKNNSAEGLAAKNGRVRKRNNAQDDFDILTQADRIRMEEKVPTRVKGRKTFKVLVEHADPEEGLMHCRCPVEDALFNFIIFKMQCVFDPTTTEFTSPKMTLPVHTLLCHTLCSIADLSLDNFYLSPEYFKDNIPSTTPFPRYFSYEYQLEIAQKAMKGLLAWIRYLNHILSEGETQLKMKDIEIWQEELLEEKIAARMACKASCKEKQVEDSSDEDGMEEK
ncbi:hypothetical protein DXG01_005549 [Tephrocybe rancida]|nr:hypothetical protein DXG01_005549 [Tephrocybe rancida]